MDKSNSKESRHAHYCDQHASGLMSMPNKLWIVLYALWIHKIQCFILFTDNLIRQSNLL